MFDFIIIGAGISGLNTAYYLKTEGPKNSTYAILEGRASLGGTWDLFRYPGIRSDSDLFTFGFSWSPWHLESALAGGPEIIAYMKRSAAKEGIDTHIKYRHRVNTVSWSSQESKWTVRAVVNGDKERSFKAKFLIMGTGYYDYEEALRYSIPGIENFGGQVVQPQFWPERLDYMNKKVVIVGSGATAITLLPSIALNAAHTTMLQRSPTYIASVPNTAGALTRVTLSLLPSSISTWIYRWYYLMFGYFAYWYCIRRPESAKKAILAAAARQLPSRLPLDPHFTPRYNPWQQRLCACPDGDFFRALRSGKASVMTDIIEEVTGNQIKLKSGEALDADIIVAATGLKLRFAGGVKFVVDGQPIDLPQKYSWKGFMIQDVPNMAYIAGYANASWTVGANTSAVLINRLLKLMKSKSVSSATPRLEPHMIKAPELFISLTSTYLRNARDVFPNVAQGQWKPRQDCMVDIWEGRRSDLTTDIEFR